MRKIKSSGFTLIEVMITVALLGILAAIAYPSFHDYILKSRRSDAIAALTEASLLQEKWRANNPAYGALQDIYPSLAEGTTAKPSPEGYYNISVHQTLNTTTLSVSGDASDSSNEYVIKAAATSKNGQDQDISCKDIYLDQDGIFSPSACVSR